MFHVECELYLGAETLSYLFLVVGVDSKQTLCVLFYEVDLWSNNIRKVCALRFHNDNRVYWYCNCSMIAESGKVSSEMTQFENNVE